MIVALLRHGLDEDVNPLTGVSRGLTDAGAARMAAAARGIGRLQLPIELVVTCPDPRCRQSAEIVADANHYPLIADERLRRKADVDRLMDVLIDHWDLPGVLICSHQPDLSDIASDLIIGGDMQFKKGALAVMDLRSVRVHSAKLRGLYPPGVLHMLGGWETGNVPQIAAPLEEPVAPVDAAPVEAPVEQVSVTVDVPASDADAELSAPETASDTEATAPPRSASRAKRTKTTAG